MFKKILKHKKKIIVLWLLVSWTFAVYASIQDSNQTIQTTQNTEAENQNSQTTDTNNKGSIFDSSLNVNNSCKYASEINSCRELNKKWDNRSIDAETEYVCIPSQSLEKIAYNVVLDKEFKEVDKDVLIYLTNLEAQKDTYFGASTGTIFDAVKDLDDLFSKKWEWFYAQYEDLCQNNILKITMDCLWWKTAINNARDFIASSFDSNTCLDLAKTKLDIYHQIALNMLKLDKEQIARDERKKFTQAQRTKYDKLMDSMTWNMNYVEKINAKWNVVTKNWYNK